MPDSARTRKATRSRVVRSAQCRSSTIRTSGRSARQPAEHPQHELRTAARCCRSSAGERRRRRRPAPAAGGPAPAGRADDPVQLVAGRRPDQRAQGLDERDERQALAAQFDAPAGEHAAVGAGDRREPPGSRRLPDAGLTADEREGRVFRPGPLQLPGERGQLLPAPDEDGTDHIRAHADTIPYRHVTRTGGAGARQSSPGPAERKIGVRHQRAAIIADNAPQRAISNKRTAPEPTG